MPDQQFDSDFEQNQYQLRRSKLDEISRLAARAAGQDPDAAPAWQTTAYPSRFPARTAAADSTRELSSIPHLRRQYENTSTEDLDTTKPEVQIAGRLMSLRIQGKTAFAHLQGSGQRLQIYIRRDAVGDDLFALTKLLDLGDHIGVRGYLFRTRTGELSVHVGPGPHGEPALTFLTKALLALPDKYHGLEDTELRYRQRYVDLFMNTGDTVKQVTHAPAPLISPTAPPDAESTHTSTASPNTVISTRGAATDLSSRPEQSAVERPASLPNTPSATEPTTNSVISTGGAAAAERPASLPNTPSATEPTTNSVISTEALSERSESMGAAERPLYFAPLATNSPLSTRGATTNFVLSTEGTTTNSVISTGGEAGAERPASLPNIPLTTKPTTSASTLSTEGTTTNFVISTGGEAGAERPASLPNIPLTTKPTTSASVPSTEGTTPNSVISTGGEAAAERPASLPNTPLATEPTDPGNVREIFVKRAAILRSLRRFFDSRNYLEVETPMMHTVAGGAAARPFKTHHNALDIDLSLRIAPELFLKRLVVGGLDRVYEINRNFRNEGVSTRHNPEFTMLEFYQAYADYHDLMDLTEELVTTVATEVNGTPITHFNGHEIDLSRWQRLSMREAICKWWPVDAGDPPTSEDFQDLGRFKIPVVRAVHALGAAWQRTMPRSGVFDPHMTSPLTAKYQAIANVEKLIQVASDNGSEPDSGAERFRNALGKAIAATFEALAETELIQPTIIYDFPLAVSPLSKQKPDDPDWVERFEFYIGGFEVGNAFSELNDPVEQRLRFEQQLAERDRGDDEAHGMDEDYVRALGYGLPPTAGEGVGIDRLTMLLTGARSIRDVILFPLLRPQPKSSAPSERSEGPR